MNDVWKKGWKKGYIVIDDYVNNMTHNKTSTYVSYFECVPVGVENIECDFNVLLDALAAPLKLSPLQGQIQVIACVNYDNYTRYTF